MTGQVYAIASGKGGVGKTTTAINLGAMLAEMDREVVVVDTDLGMANVAGFLDFEMDGATLHEVLAGNADVADATYDAPGDVTVLPSSVDIHAFADSETENLQQVVAELRASYDVVLLDTGAGISYDTMLPLSLADSVLLVTTPDVASVRDTAKTGELTDHVGGTVRGAVLTQRSSDILNAEDVEGTLDADVLTVVPEDETVPMGIDAGRPLAAFAPNSPAATAYRGLAEVLLGVADAPAANEPAADAPEDATDADAPNARASDASASDASTSPDAGEPPSFTPDSRQRADDSAPSLADAESELADETPDDEPDRVHDLIDERIVEASEADTEARGEDAETGEAPDGADESDEERDDATTPGAADAPDAADAADATDETASGAAPPGGDAIDADGLAADHFATGDTVAGTDADGADGSESSNAGESSNVGKSSSNAAASGDAGRDSGDHGGHDGDDRDGIEGIEGIEEAEPDTADIDVADDAVPTEERPPERTELGKMADADDDDDAGIFGRIGSLFK